MWKRSGTCTFSILKSIEAFIWNPPGVLFQHGQLGVLYWWRVFLSSVVSINTFCYKYLNFTKLKQEFTCTPTNQGDVVNRVECRFLNVLLKIWYLSSTKYERTTVVVHIGTLGWITTLSFIRIGYITLDSIRPTSDISCKYTSDICFEFNLIDLVRVWG